MSLLPIIKSKYAICAVTVNKTSVLCNQNVFNCANGFFSHLLLSKDASKELQAMLIKKNSAVEFHLILFRMRYTS